MMKETDTEKFASEDEKMALRGFQNEIVRLQKEEFLEKGELEPHMYIGLAKHIEEVKQIVFVELPVGVFMGTEQDKETLSKIMHEIGSQVEPLCICMTMEAWYVEGKVENEKELLKVKPRDHPDRREGVVCTFESENLNRSFKFEIFHTGGIVSLGEDSGDGKLDTSAGRFSGMLKDMKKIKYN